MMPDDMSVGGAGGGARGAQPAARRLYEFDLPIGVLDEDGQLHRQGTLRKMTGKDEAILADQQNQRNGGRLVTELLHSCIVTLGTLRAVGAGLVANMYSADRNYLLLRLRSITFGPELAATYRCPSCTHSWEVVENVDELPLRRLEEGESAEQIAVQLEDGYVDPADEVHTALVLRLPTGADESAVAPQMRKNPSLGKNALLSRCLRSLGNVPPHRLNALGPRILSELTMTDRRLIDRALNAAAPGVDLLRALECPACGHEFKASLDLSRFLAVD